MWRLSIVARAFGSSSQTICGSVETKLGAIAFTRTPSRPDPGGERAHHRRHAALGRGVRVEAGAADERVDRARDDDRARALGDHLPPDVLEDQERPRQVDVDDPMPDVVVELGQAPVLRVDEVNVGGAVVERRRAGRSVATVSATRCSTDSGDGDVDLHRRRLCRPLR